MSAKMGMKTFALQNGTKIDAVEQGGGALLAGSSFLKEFQERHAVLQQPKGMEKSILDDIMGDPEDFRALGDSDGESEGDLPGQCGLNAAVAVEKETIQGDNSQSQAEAEAKRKFVGDDENLCTNPKTQDFIKKAQSISSGKDNTHLSPREMKVNRGCFSSEKQFYKDMESNCIKHVEANGGQRTNVQAGGTRYFIIKSLNHHNLEKSVKKGIWATQAMNEPILNEAFENSERVLLIFSVNMSGHFQGYAQMVSSIGQSRACVWNETNWGGTFNVEWIRLYDLPFQRTIHLKNPLNFFKPVKISRDCQELTEEIGEALCALIDEGADSEGRTKRRSAHFGDGFAKKACTERMPWANSDLYGRAGTMPVESPWASLMYPYGFPTSFSNDLYNPQVPVTISGFSAQASITNPTSIYQHRVSWSSSLVSGSPRKDVGGCQERKGKREQLEGRERPLLREHKKETSRVDVDSGAAGVPIDDDFLNMTYEEYLQRVGDASDHAHHQQGVSIWSRADEHW